MERETCGAGEREHAHRVVVHPPVVDGGEGSVESVGCVVPPSSIHREERALGLTDDERIGVARSRRHGGRLLEGRLGSLGLAHEQVRLSGEAERLVAPRAPRRLLGDRERRVGHRLLRARGAHRGAEHRPRGGEGCGAVRRGQVEGCGIDDRRPSLGVCRLPRHRRHPPGQDGERGIPLDRVVAERRQPPLDRRHLSGRVRFQRQGRREVHTALSFVRIQQVVKGDRRGTVRFVPVGGTQVELHDDVGLDPTEFAFQELPEQGVVAIPAPSAIERDQERVGPLQVPQHLVRSCRLEDRIAERAAHLIEHRRPPKEALGLLRQLHHGLAIEVVGDVPVVTRDREGIGLPVARDQRREVETDRPPLGPFDHRGRRVVREADAGLREDLLGPGWVEGEVLCREFQRIARCSESRDVWLLGPARGHELRALRDTRDHHAQHVVTRRRPKLVQIVEHEHERRWARPQHGREARSGASEGRRAEAPHVGDQVGVLG